MKTKENSKGLDLEAEIIEFLRRTQQHARLVESPKKVEFKCLALLAAWEATTKADSDASYWLQSWRLECAALHPDQSALSLADLPARPDCHGSPPVSETEEAKAYSKVRDGLRRVLKATCNYYFPDVAIANVSLEVSSSSSILLRLINRSFKALKSVAPPAGYEIFLLTLIETFEQSLPSSGDELRSRLAWQSEIRRRRLGGPAQTKTLPDIKPVKERMKDLSDFSGPCRQDALSQLLKLLKRLVTKMSKHLSS